MNILLIILFCWLGWLAFIGLLFLLSLAVKRDCLSWAKWLSDPVRWIIQLGVIVGIPILLFVYLNQVLAVILLIVFIIFNRLAEPVGNVLSAPLWFPLGFLVDRLDNADKGKG
jgi:hypothetical protein